ncbi:hypothetical protein LINPERHAP1_LOCUS13540, partial [Linum perenne]
VLRRFTSSWTLWRLSRPFWEIQRTTLDTAGCSITLTSSVRATEMSLSPTLLEKATELLICLPTTGIPLILIFMLIVLILLRLIGLSGMIMLRLVFPKIFP